MLRAPSLVAAGLLALVSACGGDAPAAPGGAETPGAGPRTVVIISLDTLRPDRLDVYGGPAGNAPVLAALAGEALVFDEVLAPSPWTLPSHMTMLTGLDPIAHGVRNSSHVLSSKSVTLAERLAEEGFTTGAFTDGGYVSGVYGFEQGFDVYEDERATDGSPNGWARLLPDALDWLEARDDDEDVFLFLHTFDAHAPYQDCDPQVLARFRERPVADGPRDHALFPLRYVLQQQRMRLGEYGRIEEVLRDYDAGVFEADRGVGRVLEVLRALGRYDDALVIVTSDHGESFLDHGLHVGHGLRLTDDELAIPLLVKFPDGTGAGARSDAPAGLVDVVPTVLATLGLPFDATLSGHDLRELFARGRRPDALLAVSQNLGDVLALVWNGYKYVSPMTLDPRYITKRHLSPFTPPVLAWMDEDEKEYETGNGETLRYDFKADVFGLQDRLPWHEQLFERGTDPGERRDLSGERPEIVAPMREQALAVWQRSFALHESLLDEGESDVSLSPTADKMLEQLKSLGYAAGGDDVAPELGDAPAVGGSGWIPPPWQREVDAPLDETLLADGDRLVHAVRLQIEGGALLSKEMTDTLQRALDRYRSWLRLPEHRPVWRQKRALWRISELAALANAAGLKITPEQLARGQIVPRTREGVSRKR